ncbi:transposase [Streptomyces sp. NPDC051657]|uniref:transposase n=1 Tax=unclassified Streptomyces TaxID=2593676 RepID=UPI0034120E14
MPERSWSNDCERRREAGIPEDVQFATKPRLAWEMIETALDAGINASWVTGDEAYGQDPQLRLALETRETGHVLAVACSTRVRINQGSAPARADSVAGPSARHGLATAQCRQRRVGPALLRLGLGPHRHWQPPPSADPPQPDHRRTRLLPVLVTHRSDAGRTGPRRRCPLEHRGVLPGRQEPGRARPIPGQALWILCHRHITLAMLALAFLTAISVASAAPHRPTEPHHPTRKHEPIHPVGADTISQRLDAVTTCDHLSRNPPDGPGSHTEVRPLPGQPVLRLPARHACGRLSGSLELVARPLRAARRRPEP